jgi:hypothetical protein
MSHGAFLISTGIPDTINTTVCRFSNILVHPSLLMNFHHHSSGIGMGLSLVTMIMVVFLLFCKSINFSFAC